MIKSIIQTSIVSQPDTLFEYIETMPNKFPIYSILETKPFLFLRLFLFDGYQSAVDSIKFKRPENELILTTGDTMGPFTLIESHKPSRYWFRLDSICFNCTTGYSIKTENNQVILNLDLFAENPSIGEKIWWFFAKPFHEIFTKKVLKNIKETIENKST